eukprot:TRINITY_DN10807_c0_g1_i8.p1 TRINITY_DN10807_c0_g1~~TRINITY_DN10807_c0_g1_i8.p1  ORF type:complete len:475 (-),score=65.38 TRINITY_DN10807_c0_g1_i8:109-1533(-)
MFKKAGILDEPKKFKKVAKIICSVCEDQVLWEHSSALECQHRFCDTCWKGSISSNLSSSTFQQLFNNLKCMHRGCHCSILGHLIKKVSRIENELKMDKNLKKWKINSFSHSSSTQVVDEKEWHHYVRMLVRSYLEVNSSTSAQCPNMACLRIAKINSMCPTPSKIVSCECGNSYCFGCGMTPHVPASCRDLERWKAKDSDEESSINLIKATTTQCPSCGRNLDRITACNHITCGCSHQFCFVCKSRWGSCSVYSCSKFKTVEESEMASKKEFAPGYKTSSDWLVQHERFVAFSRKFVTAASKCEKLIQEKPMYQQNALDYRSKKPGANPQFILNAWEILYKSWRIIQFTFVWGFWNIPAQLCPQKSIYEMQIKNYEKLLDELEKTVGRKDIEDDLKVKHLSRSIEDNLVKKIEEAEDLLALFSEAPTSLIKNVSVLARWSCTSCNYSNHPVEQEKQCGHCGFARPEVKIVWFPE